MTTLYYLPVSGHRADATHQSSLAAHFYIILRSSLNSFQFWSLCYMNLSSSSFQAACTTSASRGCRGGLGNVDSHFKTTLSCPGRRLISACYLEGLLHRVLCTSTQSSELRASCVGAPQNMFAGCLNKRTDKYAYLPAEHITLSKDTFKSYDNSATKKTSNPMRKWARVSNWHFSKEDIQTANKYRKRRST